MQSHDRRGIVVGATTAGVTCKRIADTRPVVIEKSCSAELPFWLLQESSRGHSRPEVSGLLATLSRNPQQALTVSGCGAGNDTPTPKLSDVSNSFNLDIKIDDQELSKFMCERNHRDVEQNAATLDSMTIRSSAAAERSKENFAIPANELAAPKPKPSESDLLKNSLDTDLIESTKQPLIQLQLQQGTRKRRSAFSVGDRGRSQGTEVAGQRSGHSLASACVRSGLRPMLGSRGPVRAVKLGVPLGTSNTTRLSRSFTPGASRATASQAQRLKPEDALQVSLASRTVPDPEREAQEESTDAKPDALESAGASSPFTGDVDKAVENVGDSKVASAAELPLDDSPVVLAQFSVGYAVSPEPVRENFLQGQQLDQVPKAQPVIGLPFESTEVCPSCSNGYVLDAMFCRQCGHKRESAQAMAVDALTQNPSIEEPGCYNLHETTAACPAKEPAGDALKESLGQLSDLLTERIFVPARNAAVVSSSATTVAGASGETDIVEQVSAEPAGEALRDSMHQLTAQLRGLFHSLNSEEQPELEREEQSRHRYPLTTSLAQSAHTETERNVFDDVVSKGTVVSSSAETEIGVATQEAARLLDRLSADDNENSGDAGDNNDGDRDVEADDADDEERGGFDSAMTVASAGSTPAGHQASSDGGVAQRGPGDATVATIKATGSLLVPSSSSSLGSTVGTSKIPAGGSGSPQPNPCVSKRASAGSCGASAGRILPRAPAPPLEPRPCGTGARRIRAKSVSGEMQDERETHQRDKSASKESAPQRRRRLGLVTIPRGEGELVGRQADETRSHQEIAASGDEAKRRRSSGWYTQTVAKELITEVQRETDVSRRQKEEREKRRQENLRRLENTYARSRRGSSSSVGPGRAGVIPQAASEVSEVRRRQPSRQDEGEEEKEDGEEEEKGEVEDDEEDELAKPKVDCGEVMHGSFDDAGADLIGQARSCEQGRPPLEHGEAASAQDAQGLVAEAQLLENSGTESSHVLSGDASTSKVRRRPSSAPVSIARRLASNAHGAASGPQRLPGQTKARIPVVAGNGVAVGATGNQSRASRRRGPPKRWPVRPRLRRLASNGPEANAAHWSFSDRRGALTSAMTTAQATAEDRSTHAEVRCLHCGNIDTADEVCCTRCGQRQRLVVPEIVEEEEDVCWTEPEVGVRPVLAWAAAVAARTRLAASLSDGGESLYSSRWSQEASRGRLADRIRSATLERARHVRMSRHLETSDDLASCSHELGEEDAWPSLASQDLERPCNVLESEDTRLPGARPGAEEWFSTEHGALAWREDLLQSMESAAAVRNASNLPVFQEGHDDRHGGDVEDSPKEGGTVDREEDDDDDVANGSASYLTAEDRQRIGEVLAERRRLRHGVESVPEALPPSWPMPTSPVATVAGSRAASAAAVLAGIANGGSRPNFGTRPSGSGRPPSRGGESWQPLGQTTPPAYEQVTPELFETYQELIPTHTGPPSASPPQSLLGHEATDDDSEDIDDVEHTMHAEGDEGHFSSPGGRSAGFGQEHPAAIRMLHPTSNSAQPATLLASFSASGFVGTAPAGLNLVSSEDEEEQQKEKEKEKEEGGEEEEEEEQEVENKKEEREDNKGEKGAADAEEEEEETPEGGTKGGSEEEKEKKEAQEELETEIQEQEIGIDIEVEETDLGDTRAPENVEVSGTLEAERGPCNEQAESDDAKETFVESHQAQGALSPTLVTSTDLPAKPACPSCGTICMPDAGHCQHCGFKRITAQETLSPQTSESKLLTSDKMPAPSNDLSGDADGANDKDGSCDGDGEVNDVGFKGGALSHALDDEESGSLPPGRLGNVDGRNDVQSDPKSLIDDLNTDEPQDEHSQEDVSGMVAVEDHQGHRLTELSSLQPKTLPQMPCAPSSSQSLLTTPVQKDKDQLKSQLPEPPEREEEKQLQNLQTLQPEPPPRTLQEQPVQVPSTPASTLAASCAPASSSTRRATTTDDVMPDGPGLANTMQAGDDGVEQKDAWNQLKAPPSDCEASNDGRSEDVISLHGDGSHQKRDEVVDEGRKTDAENQTAAAIVSSVPAKLHAARKPRQDPAHEASNPEQGPPSPQDLSNDTENTPQHEQRDQVNKRSSCLAGDVRPGGMSSSSDIPAFPAAPSSVATASGSAATPQKTAGALSKIAGACPSSPGQSVAEPVETQAHRESAASSGAAPGTGSSQPFAMGAASGATSVTAGPEAKAAGESTCLASSVASNSSTGIMASPTSTSSVTNTMPVAHTTPPLRASAIAPPVSPMTAARANSNASIATPHVANRAAAGAAPWIGTQNVAVKVNHSNSSLSNIVVAAGPGRSASDPCGSPGTGRLQAPLGSAAGRTPQSEEDGDISSGTSASNSNAWLASPGRSESYVSFMKDMMLRSKHKNVMRQVIPSFPSPDEPHMQHSAPSSTRSLQSNSSSSSAAACHDPAMEGDRFTRFTIDLAKKIDKEEEARASMVEQLFRLQQAALQKKVREKLRHLKVMDTDRSPRWVEKRMRKVRMRAEAENAEIERQMADIKALSLRRKLRLSEVENQVYSWRSSTLRLKKRTHSSEPGVDQPASAQAVAGSSRASSAPPSRGDASPFSSGYSTPSSTPSSSTKLLPKMTAALTAKVGAIARGQQSALHNAGDGGGSASAVSRPDSSTSPGSVKAPAGDTATAASEQGLVTQRSSATEHGNATERSSATVCSGISESSVPLRVSGARQKPQQQQAEQAQTQKQKQSKQPSQRQETQKSNGSVASPSASAVVGAPGVSLSSSSSTASVQKPSHELQPQGSASVQRRQVTREQQSESELAGKVPLQQAKDALKPVQPSRVERDSQARVQMPSSVAASTQKQYGPLTSPAGGGASHNAFGSSAATSGVEDSLGKGEESSHSERVINAKLESLRRDMEATKNEIQAARNLQEKEAHYAVLKKQKEAACRLYEEKQQLVIERVTILQLEQEEREVNDLLDKALNLSVDEEVQRQIRAGVSISKPHEAVSIPKPPDSLGQGASKTSPRSTHEWEARETHLEHLRSELEERRRSVQQLHAERVKHQQSREEERLMRELQQVEDEAEKLRHPPESDAESTGSGRTKVAGKILSSTTKMTGLAASGLKLSHEETSTLGSGIGRPIPDAIDETDLQLAGQQESSTRKSASFGELPRSPMFAGAEVSSELHRSSPRAAMHSQLLLTPLRSSPRGVLEPLLNEAPEHELLPTAVARDEASGSSKDHSILELCEDPLSRGAKETEAVVAFEAQAALEESRSRVPSVASTPSSDEQWRIEEVEVVGGSGPFQVDEWVISPSAARVGEFPTDLPTLRQWNQSLPEQAPSSSTLNSFASPAAETPTGKEAGGVYADLCEDACAPQTPNVLSSTGLVTERAAVGVGFRGSQALFAEGATVDVSDPACKAQVTNEIVSVVMNELIDDSIQTASAPLSTEPALRHPTPVAAASLITDMFNEDGASSVESEPAVLMSHHRPPIPSDSSVAPMSVALETRPVTSKHSSSANDGEEDSRRGGKSTEKLPSVKEPGPPRPPSPPPDMRQETSGQSPMPITQNRYETADLISQELMDMLLGEVWEELGAEFSTSPQGVATSSPASLSEETPTSVGSMSGPSPPPTHLHAIDTSDAVVGEFLDAAFRALGVTDETSTVYGTFPSMEEWLPSILDVMRKRESEGLRRKSQRTKNHSMDIYVDAEDEETQSSACASCGGAKAGNYYLCCLCERKQDLVSADDDEGEEEEPIDPSNPSGPGTISSTRDIDVDSFTRLLAESMLEIAGEQVKEKGPRILGWRRPGFGEPPMSRFREKQVEEGKAATQQQTWEKVRTKLVESVRFGSRGQGSADNDPGTAAAGAAGMGGLGGGVVNLDFEFGASSAAGAALANIDEGIDALLEEEICSDEASWLDIRSDVREVKNQVAHMIFTDLIEEVVVEIGSIWSC